MILEENKSAQKFLWRIVLICYIHFHINFWVQFCLWWSVLKSTTFKAHSEDLSELRETNIFWLQHTNTRAAVTRRLNCVAAKQSIYTYLLFLSWPACRSIFIKTHGVLPRSFWCRLWTFIFKAKLIQIEIYSYTHNPLYSQ